MSDGIDLSRLLKPVAIRPLPTLAPTRSLPIGTIQNLGQMYQVQTYNNGVTQTKNLSYMQLIGELNPQFTPETIASLGSLSGSQAQLLGSAKISAADAQKILQDSLKGDYLLGIKSQESLPVELNMMQTPTLTAEMVYNFYSDDESDIASQEDQAQDPLLFKEDPPRYVSLTWDTVSTVNPSQDFEPRTPTEAALVAAFTNPPKGIATTSNAKTANSYQAAANKTQTIQRDGQNLKLVDTHDLERGFNSTSNSRIFKNAALTVINVNNVDVSTVNFTDLFIGDLEYL